MSLHGEVIHFCDIERLIPQRSVFLDTVLLKKVNKNVNSGKDILFMPNSTWDDKPMQNSQYDKSKYKLVLFGILEDGQRASVVINDIEPYFEVKIPDTEQNPEGFAQNLYENLFMCDDDFNRFKNALNVARTMPTFGFKIEPTRFEIVTGKPLHNFQTYTSNYIKIYFNKLAHRKDAISYVRAIGHTTAHDDLSCYYRVVSRDYFLQLGSWLKISKYLVKSNTYIKGDVIQVSITDIGVYTGEITKHLLKDNTMSMAFDIETYNSSCDGEIPMPAYRTHNMFMISMTFQWYHASTQLLQVCLVDVPCAPHPDFVTIICGTEQNLIMGFAQIFAKMRPELVMGFNSDNYDWPWIIERAQVYPGLLSKVVDLFDVTIQNERTDAASLLSYKKSCIKVEATLSVDGQNLQTPGYIPFDVMTVFRKLYPTSEQYSLNFFLSKNKLGGKEDMPYMEMFKIYADTLALVKSGLSVTPVLLDKMALVAKYCVVDSARCHDLTNIRNVLPDKRAVANISYTSVYDAFYRADGMKVRNLVISRAQLRNLKISNIPMESAIEGKYPGAWVFPPVKGLAVSKLSIVERIEKAKLGYVEYAEWLAVTPEEITTLKEHISVHGPAAPLFTDNPRKCFNDMLSEHISRPITGLDYSSLYPSLMMAYNLSPEYMITTLAKAKAVNKLTNPDGTKMHDLYKIKFEYNNDVVRGWSVRHDNKLDPTQPDFKFGIFPTILKELFDARKQLKSGPLGLNHWEHEKEKLMALPIEQFESAEVKSKFNDICFNYNTLDSKQRALKVYMNCFYGELGSKRSPLFMIQVAGGITMAGRDNIKRAYDYVKEKDCSVYYGDSVTPDTPILIRYTDGPLAGSIDIRAIDNIPFEIVDGYSESEDDESNVDWSTKWYAYPQFKPNDKGLVNKKYHYPIDGLETWTHLGWKPIKRIIRHKTNKKIIRINTFKGLVDVTEDHSLLTDKLEKISPKDADIGDKLFHSFPTEFPSEPKFEEIIIDESNEILLCARCKENKPRYEFYSGGNAYGKWCKKCKWLQNQKREGMSTDMKEYFSETEYLLNVGKNLTEDEAWVWGAGHADGCFKNYKYKGENNNVWCINKLDLNHLNIILEKLKTVEPFFQFKIILKTPSQNTNKIQAFGRLTTLVKKYTNLLYDKRDYKIVPACILNAPINIRRAYFEGFTAGDGWKNDKGIINFCQKGKINAQGLYYLMRSIGYNDINVLTQEYKPDIYWIYTVENKSPPEIRKMFKVNNILNKSYGEKKCLEEQLDALNISTDNDMEYVYDIETEVGTFQGGVGNLVVSNTDSIYISTPEIDFKQIDIDYYTEKISKLEYWTQLVSITFDAIKPINTDVNNMLEANNGTKFLKMAYEEALFPVAFLAKKKYFGLPHISQPNFNENAQLFIRGLELKKRGVSEVLINVCNDILNKAVSHKNILTIMEIVENKIVEFYKTDWSTPELFSTFIMTGIYKPNKQNVKMHTFKKRMMDERGIDILPGERIKYVIVKKYPYKFDMRGCKTALSIGDTMELADKASEENIPINIDYYMDKTINGQLARFITYHNDFHVHINDADDTEEIKKAELVNLKLARKFVDDYCKKYYTNYANKGGIYKTIFTKSALVVKNKMIQVCGEDKSTNVIIKLLGFSIDPDEDLEQWIFEKIQKDVERKSVNKMFGEIFIARLISPESIARSNTTKAEYMLTLQDTYYANKTDNISKIAEAYYHDRQQILEIRFRQSINSIKKMYHANNNVIEKVANHIKSLIDIDNRYNDSVLLENEVIEKDINAYLEPAGIDVCNLNNTLDTIAETNINYNVMTTGINELKFIYYNLVSNYEYVYQIRSIVLCLKAYRNKKINYIKPTDALAKKKMLETFISESVKETMQSYTN